MTHDKLEPIMATLGFYQPSVLHCSCGAATPPVSRQGGLKGLRVHDSPVLKYIVGDTGFLHPVLGTILRLPEPNQYTISPMSV